MCRISRICCSSQHDCVIRPNQEQAPRSLCQRISDAYQRAIQDFSQFLFRKGWVNTSLVIGGLFGEPCESIKSTFRRFFLGWKSNWKQNGFHDAGDLKDFKALKYSPLIELPGVLLLHGKFCNPSMYRSFVPQLQQAQKEGKIGHVFTMQLPNSVREAEPILRKAIDGISAIYQAVRKDREAERKGHEAEEKTGAYLDLVGFSLGGYLAHLAAYLHTQVFQVIKGKNIERRWHRIGPGERNPLVRKVISIAAPTWSCCQGQTDQTTKPPPRTVDIYPQGVFTHKTIEAYTPGQLEEIRKNHEGIFDIVATDDAISATISPLPPDQIRYVKHGHLASATCSKVCELVINILAPANVASAKITPLVAPELYPASDKFREPSADSLQDLGVRAAAATG